MGEAEEALEQSTRGWDTSYLMTSLKWRRDWIRPAVFFDYPSDIRRVLETIRGPSHG